LVLIVDLTDKELSLLKKPGLNCFPFLSRNVQIPLLREPAEKLPAMVTITNNNGAINEFYTLVKANRLKCLMRSWPLLNLLGKINRIKERRSIQTIRILA
jgi:hypothetical protein